MKPDLSDRLNRLKKGPAGKGPLKSEKVSGTPVDIAPPKGWIALERDVWKREISCPDPLRNMTVSGYLAPRDIPLSRWLFFDTETTGLSGGAGTMAFLIGLGRQVGDRFLTTQYFLRDYPGEPVLLNFLKEELSQADLFISYNGKTFDSHLLQTRFLLNRIPFQFGAQLDLLYPVRQLYRRTLPDCRLGTTESFLLQMPRQGDIPGSEIPDLWFGFLKDGNGEALTQVFEHNRLDIVRMADLLAHLEGVLKEPNVSKPYRDLFALGRFLLERDNPLGEELLEQALYRGDPRAEVYLSVHWKRAGEWEKAVRLWQSILRRRPGHFAGVELAKYLEHRKKAPDEALEVMDVLLRELPLRDPVKRAALQHRRRRIVAKIRNRMENKKDG